MIIIRLRIRIFYLLMIALPVHAQWTNDLLENTVVSYFINWPILVPDGNNGAVVFGYSREISPKVYAQRISVDGSILWPGPLGIEVSNAFHEQRHTHGSENKRFALVDGAGGAFIGFRVWRIIGQWPEVGDVYDVRVYLQRLNSSGNRLFGPEGLWLLPGELDSSGFYQEIKNWSSDGHGGLYVVLQRLSELEKTRNGIYLSRISRNGEVMWGPIQLSNHYEDDFLPYLDRRLNLNLYKYPGETVPPGGYQDMFVKIDASTGKIISERPIEIGVGEFGFSVFYDYCQSNDGSAIIAFSDLDRSNLRVQKLDSDGQKLWGEEPVLVDQGLYLRGWFDIDSDQKDGIYLWYLTGSDSVLHMAHLDGQGRESWQREFLVEGSVVKKSHLLPNPMLARPMSVTPDGTGLFILTDGFQRLTKLASTGEVLWQTPISVRADTILMLYIDSYTLLADSAGGCLVLWEEVGEFNGLRAQRVDRYGHLGGQTSVQLAPLQSNTGHIIILSINPNPFNGLANIRFSLPDAQFITLNIYDILGKEVRILKKDYLLAGSYLSLWDGTDYWGQPLPSGIYLLMLQSESQRVLRKITMIR